MILYDYTGEDNCVWEMEPKNNKFAKGKASPPVSPYIATAKAASEREYNCWPASSASDYYGKADAVRHTALSAIKMKATATASGGIALKMPDAAMMLLLFTNGQGGNAIVDGVYTLDFKRMIDEWDYANSQRKVQLNEALAAIEALVSSGEAANVYTVEAFDNRNPDKSNWHNAVGAYSTRVMCRVMRSGNRFSAKISYYFNDFYDWNKNETAENSLCSQREMWELHHGGYAKQYEVQGTNNLTVIWTLGQRIGAGADLSDAS